VVARTVASLVVHTGDGGDRFKNPCPLEYSLAVIWVQAYLLPLVVGEVSESRIEQPADVIE
jgi:hypothetical protein